MVAAGSFMRNSDAFTWEMEHDPVLRSTIVTVMVLEKPPDWDTLVSRLERVAETVPMFRHRVVESPPPAPPRWEPAPDFDLDWHLRRVTAPAPGTIDTVLEMARRAQMADFDRVRPLWEVTLVDGLEGGVSALVLKLHHALTDGIGGVQLAMTLFDLTPDVAEVVPHSTLAEVEPPGLGDGYRQTVGYEAGVVRGAARSLALGLPRTGAVRTAPGDADPRGRGHRRVGVPHGAPDQPHGLAADDPALAWPATSACTRCPWPASSRRHAPMAAASTTPSWPA